ncbi:PREDICTED: 2'-5'-oligoadenylate synthase 1-like [Merops nubicus]|uniref:2'-5'-oligoadenylate synthase 1-like n=1 Tax=Merops nubicus TaxID=57421 RepID=UPI0004F0251F|nr:PREDICTED: 2'-5'-oligoadenylate synthase 1-like [Merops nubicus]
MEVLQPSTAFCRQVKETVKQICDFLKEDCFENIRVQKTVKGGSAGKGTALQNKSDADVVLFLSCFSSYQEQKQDRKYILDLIKERLHACKQTLTFTVNISEPRYKGPNNTPRSLSLTLCSKKTLESIEVDILPAYDALGQVSRDILLYTEVYVGLLNASSDPGEFSPCFTELQKKFVKRCPAKLKNLLRLVKYWYKELLKPQYPTADLPPKYALELLTIYAWQEGTGSSDSFVTAAGFRTVLELLCRHQEICIYWEMYYSLQHSQIGAHVKRLLHSPRPVILDPADPTGILGQGKNWDLMAREAARHLSLLCVCDTQPWNVQPARPVTIEVMQLVGTTLCMTVSPGITIRQLKEEIEQAWGIPWYKQRLTEPQVMEVFVKDDKNRTATYIVQPTDTVRHLKEQIHTRQGPPANQQRLTYGSRELEDRHTLAHYDVQPRSTIFMLLRLRGGSGPQHSQLPACSPS